jgi:ankyrin repeat protein
MCAEKGHLVSLIQLLEIFAARSKATLWKSFRIPDFERKWLPLHYACANNHIDCVGEILKHQEGLVGLSKARRLTNNEELVLMLGKAIERRQREVVEPILLKAATTGVMKTSIDSDNKAANNERMEQTLASLELEEDDEINPTDEAGDWPLFIAAKGGFIEVVKYLHELEGYVTCPNPKTGWTPLHVASKHGQLIVVRFLLQFCQKPEHEVNGPPENPSLKRWMDIDAKGMKGETALELAVGEGQGGVVRVLLGAGASSTKPDNSGNLLSCWQFPGVQVLLERNRQWQMTE